MSTETEYDIKASFDQLRMLVATGSISENDIGIVEREVTNLLETGMAKTTAYWHPITKLRINALKKMYTYVLSNGENIIDASECGLSYSERSSLTILRFHALIAKHKVDGHHVRRQWVITHRGAQFLRNQITIPAKVKTYHNVVTDHSEEHVSVVDILGEDPKLPPTEPFERTSPVISDIKKAQMRLV